MALTVEDGTGKTDADAFVSLAAFKAYCDTRGHSYAASTDTEIEQAIVRATDYLSESFQWKGVKVNGRGATGGEQSLAWPRADVWDEEGYAVGADEVPGEVQRATYEVAKVELATPGIMQPSYTPQERVKAVSVGPISKTYDTSNTSPDSARPVLLAVRDLIGGLLKDGGANRLAGSTARV